jgi:hypothetical protein
VLQAGLLSARGNNNHVFKIKKTVIAAEFVLKREKQREGI